MELSAQKKWWFVVSFDLEANEQEVYEAPVEIAFPRWLLPLGRTTLEKEIHKWADAMKIKRKFFFVCIVRSMFRLFFYIIIIRFFSLLLSVGTYLFRFCCGQNDKNQQSTVQTQITKNAFINKSNVARAANAPNKITGTKNVYMI